MRKRPKWQEKNQRHSLHNHNSRTTAVLLHSLIDQWPNTNVIIKNFQLITYNLLNFSFHFLFFGWFRICVSLFPSKLWSHDAMMRWCFECVQQSQYSIESAWKNMMVKTGYFPIKIHWIDLFILKLWLLFHVFYVYISLFLPNWTKHPKRCTKVVMKMPLFFSLVLMITLFMRFASKKKMQTMNEKKNIQLFSHMKMSSKLNGQKNAAMNNRSVVRQIKILVPSTRISQKSMYGSQCFMLHTSRSVLVLRDLRSSACMYCSMRETVTHIFVAKKAIKRRELIRSSKFCRNF